jgi:hypothetical protein
MGAVARHTPVSPEEERALRLSHNLFPALATSIALVLTASLSAAASDSNSVPTSPDAQQEAVDPLTTTRTDLDGLTLPMVPKEMAKLASDLTESFQAHPQFASAEVTPERDRVVVHWFGEPDDALTSALKGEPQIASIIDQTQYMPGDLRAAAEDLIRSDLSVASAGAEYDGSGITVSLVVPDQRSKSSPHTPDRLAALTGFPTFVEEARPVEASSRLADHGYHLGGARIRQFDGAFLRQSCTAGFPVVKGSDTTKKGMMFAAHCGSVGDQWVTDDGTSAYDFGKIAVRNTTYDGAILEMGFVNPYIWIGPHDTSSYVAINGVLSPFIGQEVCYSGSFSGLSCGNIVDTVNLEYNLGGDLTAVKGFRTENANGNPAAGNGDSGGPGYSIVSTPTGVKRWAVGIISAIPGDSGATCAGVPGSSAAGGRKCSPKVISTSVVLIANKTGWYVPAQ